MSELTALSSDVALCALRERLTAIEASMTNFPEGCAITETLKDWHEAYSLALAQIEGGANVGSVAKAAGNSVVTAYIMRRSALMIGCADVVFLLTGEKLNVGEVRNV